MLEINPYFRPSAKQLLKNKVFDEIRCKSDTVSAPYRVKVKIDDKEMGMNYDKTYNQPELKIKLLELLE